MRLLIVCSWCLHHYTFVRRSISVPIWWLMPVILTCCQSSPRRDVDIKTRLISLSVRQDGVLSTCPRCQCIRSGRWNTQDWTMTDQRAVLENNRTRRVAVLLRRLYARLYRYSSHFEQSVVNRDQIMHISTMHLMHAEGDQNRIIWMNMLHNKPHVTLTKKEKIVAEVISHIVFISIGFVGHIIM